MGYIVKFQIPNLLSHFNFFFVWILSVLYFEIWEFIFEFSIYISNGGLRGLSKYLYSVDSLDS